MYERRLYLYHLKHQFLLEVVIKLYVLERDGSDRHAQQNKRLAWGIKHFPSGECSGSLSSVTNCSDSSFKTRHLRTFPSNNKKKRL